MKNTILLSVFVAVASCGSLFGQSHSFEENANGIFPSAVDRSIVRHVTNDMVMGYIEQDTGRYIYCMQTNGEDVPLSFGLRAELPSTWTITDMRRYKEFMLVCGTVAGHPMYGRIPIGNGSIPGSLAVEWRTDTLLTDTLYRIAPIKYNPYVYNIIAIGRKIAITDRLGAVGFSQARTIPYTPNGEEFYDIVQDTNMYLYLLGTDIAKNALSMRRVAKAGLFSNFFCEYEMLYVPVDDAPIMINSGCCATTLPGGDIAVLHQSKTLSGMLRTDLVTIDSLSMDCKKRQVCMNQNKVSFRDVTYIYGLQAACHSYVKTVHRSRRPSLTGSHWSRGSTVRKYSIQM